MLKEVIVMEMVFVLDKMATVTNITLGELLFVSITSNPISSRDEKREVNG